MAAVRRVRFWIGRGVTVLFLIVALAFSVGALTIDNSEAVHWTVTAMLAGGFGAILVTVRGRWGGTFRRPVPGPAQRDYLVPRELPPALGPFVGRDWELQLITRHLTAARPAGPDGGGPRLVVIRGVAGIGKTSLAIRVAHLLAAHYPDGQLFATLRRPGPGSLGEDPVDPMEQLRYEVLGGFVKALKQPGEQVPTDLDDRLRRYQEMTRNQRVLIVLDAVEDADLVHSVLPTSAGCAVLITTRYELAGLAAEAFPVVLGALNEEESRLLLREIVGTRIDQEPDETDEIIDATGGHPLSVQVVAASLAARPHTPLAVANQQAAAEEAVSQPAGPDPYAGALNLAYALLTEEERHALRLLALLDRDRFRAWMLAALMEDEDHRVDERAAQRIADRLVAVGLVERTSEDSAGVPVFSVPEHVYAYASARLRETVPAEDQGRRVAELELRQVSRRQPRPTGELNDKVYAPLVEGRLFEALSGARETVALARDSADRLAEGLALAAFAEVRAELGSHDAAEDLANSALRKAVATDLSRARANRCLGRLRRRARQLDQARLHLETARVAAEVTNDTSEEIRILLELAVVQSMSLTPTVALDSIGRARTLNAARPGGGLPNLAGLGWAQSVVHQALGDLDKAWSCLDQAGRAADGLHQRLWQAWIGHRRSVVRLAGGEYEQARRYAFDALDLFSGMNHRYGKGHCRRTVGLTHLGDGRYADAARALAEALENFVNCGDRWIEAKTASQLAEAYTRGGERPDDAVQLLVTAARTFEDLGDEQSLASIKGQLVALGQLSELAAPLPPDPDAVPAGAWG
jgi:tetratricopeptide (TPR) repeat protein